MSDSSPASTRSTIKQAPKRAHYDQETIYRIIDDAIIASVAIAIDNVPFAMPMAIARIDDHIYLHGSRTSRIMKSLAAGNEVCITITHLDGIVVARSGMHCSANYRSVVIHGKGKLIEGEEKATLLYEVVERLIPDSKHDYREHLPKELKATALVAVPIKESAAKVRSGGPLDDKDDLDLPHWAGVIPIEQVYGKPIPSEDLPDGINTPDYASHYKRPG